MPPKPLSRTDSQTFVGPTLDEKLNASFTWATLPHSTACNFRNPKIPYHLVPRFIDSQPVYPTKRVTFSTEKTLYIPSPQQTLGPVHGSEINGETAEPDVGQTTGCGQSSVSKYDREIPDLSFETRTVSLFDETKVLSVERTSEFSQKRIFHRGGSTNNVKPLRRTKAFSNLSAVEATYKKPSPTTLAVEEPSKPLDGSGNDPDKTASTPIYQLSDKTTIASTDSLTSLSSLSIDGKTSTWKSSSSKRKRWCSLFDKSPGHTRAHINPAEPMPAAAAPGIHANCGAGSSSGHSRRVLRRYRGAKRKQNRRDAAH